MNTSLKLPAYNLEEALLIDDGREAGVVDIVRAENERLKSELVSLRQLILQTDPSVMLDGRFEKMMVAPINIIAVARSLIEQIPNMEADTKH
jgi:hypothetical protein